jgi:hypothetical protein
MELVIVLDDLVKIWDSLHILYLLKKSIHSRVLNTLSVGD